MLKDQIKKLNDELYKLKNPSTDLKYTTNRNIFNVLEEGKLAMKKYTEKLKKENAKYAKQKQSKG